MDIDKLKKQLDDQVQAMTEEHGQKFAEEQAAKYLEELTKPERILMKPVFDQLLACPQIDFYKLWYPIVDTCLVKNFKVYKAFKASDHIGLPAVGFEIVEGQQDEFRQLTSDNVGKQMALIIDGRVVTAPTIEDALPGAGIIRGQFTDEDVAELLTFLTN